MSDELLPYYNRELTFIRKMAAEFAAAHPKIAGRLRMSGETAEDPHVARMIESFALLNARTRHKIEDDFPEITEAVLGVLYPHYLAPTPSMAIVQFSLDDAQSELTAGYEIPRGSPLETEPIEGEPCRFRTGYDATLWPIRVSEASLEGHPFSAPATPFADETKAVVRLKLTCLSPKVTVDQLEMRKLRFFLHGQSQHVYALYEMLLNNSLGVALARSAGDADRQILEPGRIQPAGFGPSEGLLPFRARSFHGYRLLTEYFAFPEKYLFIDLTGFSPAVLAKLAGSPHLELYIYLDCYDQDLERNVTAQTFQLGCTPIVNLFTQRAEPIRLTQTQYEYRVVPDARRPVANEVYSVDRVVGTSADDETADFLPFYSLQHGAAGADHHRFWYAARRPAEYAGGQRDHASEVFLSLVDLNFNPAVSNPWTLHVETTCLNRNLPNRLPFGGGQPRLQLTEGGTAALVKCLTPPTSTRRPALRHGTLWRLVSHLSLNHLSLLDHEKGAEALREILRLYDTVDSAETQTMIDGLQRIGHRRAVGRVGGTISAGFCRGVEVTLHLDEAKFAGSGMYLFASVLDRFLGLYASLNSFTRTVVTTNKREGVFCQWPPRAGQRVLV